jgi:hypothetical protein
VEEIAFFDALFQRKRLAWVQSSHFWFPSMLMYRGTEIDELKEVNIVRVVEHYRLELKFDDQRMSTSVMTRNYETS